MAEARVLEGTRVILNDGRRAFLNNITPEAVKFLIREKVQSIFDGELGDEVINVSLSEIAEVLE